MKLFRTKQKSMIALALCDQSIHALQLTQTNNGASVFAVSRQAMEPGIINHGEIMKPAQVVESLYRLLSSPQEGEFTGRDCFFILPERHCFHRITHCRQSNASGAENYIASDFIASTPHLGENLWWNSVYTDKDGHGMIAYSQGVSRPFLQSWKDVLTKTGLAMRASESSAASLLRRLYHGAPQPEPVLHLRLDEQESMLFLSDPCGIHRSTTISDGIGSWMAREARLHPGGRKTVNNFFSAVGLRSLRHERVRDMQSRLTPFVDLLCREARQLQAFYAIEHPYADQILSLHISGNGALIPGLAEALREGLRNDERFWHPEIKLFPSQSSETGAEFDYAHGGALASFEDMEPEFVSVL